MQIIRISPRGFGSNTYLLTVDNKTAVVIDPGNPRVESELIKRGLSPAYVLLTHCHFDHAAGVEVLQAAGAKVLCGAEEKPLVGTQAELAELFGAPRTHYTVDDTFKDGETKELCGISFTALHTPGHTAGGVCYLVEDNGEKHLFSGDTLFAGTIGRTDFPTGNIGVLRKSLQRLAALDDMPVYPGHEEETTIAREKTHNPFLAE